MNKNAPEFKILQRNDPLPPALSENKEIPQIKETTQTEHELELAKKLSVESTEFKPLSKQYNAQAAEFKP